MGAAVSSSLCLCNYVPGSPVESVIGVKTAYARDSIGTPELNSSVAQAQAPPLKPIPEDETTTGSQEATERYDLDASEGDGGSGGSDVCKSSSERSEASQSAIKYSRTVSGLAPLRRLRSALREECDMPQELASDEVQDRLAALALHTLTKDELSWEYVKLAWRCYRGSFVQPLEPHPAASLLREHAQALPLEQLSRNVHTLLSTFWEVPVIEGTQRDTRKGFVDPAIRSQLASLVGAPPFRLISWKQLKALGRIPRSSEGFARTLHEIVQDKIACGEALLDEKSNPMMQMYMVSHTWFAEGKPDGCYMGRENAKAKVLAAFGDYTEKEFGREVWYWIDYSCVDQDNIQPGIRSLPLYVSSCSSFLVLWSKNYESRAWTRLEQCLFMGIGTKPAMTAISVDNSWCEAMREDANGFEAFKCLLDPRDGALSCEGDRHIIDHFVDLCQELWATGWIEDPEYWSGDTPTANTTGAAKYGPGLKSVYSLCCGTTEVMVRRMGLANGSLRVIRSHVDGTRRLSQR